MLAPLSWLKEYVDITLSADELKDRLTEIGLGVESVVKADGDVIFELEITPNRPDLFSMVGIAREIAAMEGKKVRLPKERIPKPSKKLPFIIHNDFTLLEHYVSVILAGVKIADSPHWLRNRLVKIGLRPINNIVDITNYVMFELGIPLHAFDYDEIHGHEFFVEKSKGGERFVTVDEISYTLPKDAIIIRDTDRVVDLVGIKGGLNSGIASSTKNVLLQTSSDNPVLIRRASRALSLRSDASNILEKGIDKNGLLEALYRATNLILELAGGEIASEVYILRQRDFMPRKLKLSLNNLFRILGIEIPTKKVLRILDNLTLSPKVRGVDTIEVRVPTYRNDLRIEEDLIEEVARLYGYNNFPKTLPAGVIPITKIPYSKEYRFEEKVKTLLKACGFLEIYTYSLLSEVDLTSVGINPQTALRVDNPVSREFEYLRPTLKIGLLKGLRQNQPNFSKINLFELGKVYLGKTIDEEKEEYFLSGVSNDKTFLEVKGVLERLFSELGINYNPSSAIEGLDEGIFFELNFSQILQGLGPPKTFKPIPKYPPIIEDLAIVVAPKVKIGEMIEEIKKQSGLIVSVSLLDQFENTRTFHIVYQHRLSNLTIQEVAVVRNKILKALKEKFNAKLKE